jgi:hypothetical protein
MIRQEVLEDAKRQMVQLVARQKLHSVIDRVLDGCPPDAIASVFEETDDKLAETIFDAFRWLDGVLEIEEQKQAPTPAPHADDPEGR